MNPLNFPRRPRAGETSLSLFSQTGAKPGAKESMKQDSVYEQTRKAGINETGMRDFDYNHIEWDKANAAVSEPGRALCLHIFVRSEESLCTESQALCQCRRLSAKARSIKATERIRLRLWRVNLISMRVRESMIANCKSYACSYSSLES